MSDSALLSILKRQRLTVGSRGHNRDSVT